MNAIVQQRAGASEVAPVADTTSLIAAIARAASDPQVDVAKMERLYAIHEAMVKADAERQFVAALTDFKSSPPDIIKGKQVAFGQTRYSHATLADVCAAIIDGLSRHGISHRWRTEQSDGRIRVTCILTHKAGHSEGTTLEAPPDNSGQKNAIQSIGSAVTYLQRYTLLAATGLSTRDQDDYDGRPVASAEPTISESQAADLEAMLGEYGRDIGRFKRWAKVNRLTDIRAKHYERCVEAIRGSAR